MSSTGLIGSLYSKPDDILLGSLTSGIANDQVVSQSISFAQSAVATVDRPVSVSQTITFVDGLGTMYPETVTQTLSLLSVATVAVEFHKSVSDSFTLSQDVGVVGPVYQSVFQTLNLVQDEDGHIGIVNEAVGQALVFVQKAGRVQHVSVSQSLSFTQTAERKNIAIQVLALVQTVLVGKGGIAASELDFTQVATVRGIFKRSASDNLGLHQSVAFYLQRSCTEKQYTPFVGSSTDTSFTAPSTTAPTLSRTRMTLTYPYVTPTLTLELRNPEFGDKDRLNFNRINRETRGGTLIVFADPKWPKTQTLAVQVDSLSAAQAADLLDFMQQSLGQEIGLLDWENRQWRGIITTPDAQITHVSKNDRSVAFEFQGSLV